MSAAARLTAAGKKVLLVERLNRLGGRASSEIIDGHIVNIGAIAIERGGIFEETFDMLGVPLDIREPNPATVFYIDGKVINVAKGGWGMLLGTFTKQAAKIGAKFADARAGDLPEAKLSTQPLAGRNTPPTRPCTRSFATCARRSSRPTPTNCPRAPSWCTSRMKGAFKRFGFCPRGTVGLWDDLGAGIRARGGDIWLEAPVVGMHCEDGRVTALDIQHGDGVTKRVQTGVVISNIGPTATALLPGAEAFGAD
jgi:phytoene desaturase